MTNRTCSKCGELFALLPTHKGFANVCEECAGFNLPAYVAPKIKTESVEDRLRAKKARKPMSPEAAARAMDRAITSMAHLLDVLEPGNRLAATLLTSGRFNSHIRNLGKIAKGGR